VIDVRDLRKTYRVHRRPPGLAATLRSLLHRTYEDVRAVDGVTFHIAPGERVGFLGPNGAGKTTTLKMLAGLLHPTSGDVRVAGFVPRERRPDFLKAITLVMGQKQQLLWDLPASETFALNRAVYDIPAREFEETREELVRLLELGDLVAQPVRQLSLGERMKCELAAALLHRPRVLFLDEPTIGLDVSMQLGVREFVRAWNERFGATVLLTSHYMDDVAALCRRVIVIDRGRLLFDGELDALVKSVRPEKRVKLALSKPVAAADAALPGATVVEHEAARLVLDVKPDSLQAVVGRAFAQLPVADVVVEDPPLEDVLRDLFRRARDERERDHAAAAGPA
jgi:ABC-2 type transport system ATP-binding protein